MKIGLLTGGGDAPGLNGVLESTCRALLLRGHSVLGILDGFEGIFDGKTRPISLRDVQGIHCNAGTFLGTSNKTATKGRENEFLEKYAELGLDGMVVAGGDGTFAGLKAFEKSVPIIGVPKTIDNDLSGTEVTFGYDTACSVVAEAADALRATADAHRRLIVVETMGRTAGWIALGGGLASYADAILIPERPFSRPALIEFIRNRRAQGQRGMIVVAAEGAAAKDERAQVAFEVAGSPQKERYGGVAQTLARWIEKETGWESRHVVLGHLQRAEHPTTSDRFLTLKMGVEVAAMIEEGLWGHAVVYRQGNLCRAPLMDLMAPAKLVDPNHQWVQLAQKLGLFI
ncbi:MAG: ATP-dependent 6-phosphofructokinase [Oligoflexia bacterium]|nr:ATP-dependent 6-phosphofructokinase [Oligoflexia bacterium]